ncbi:MAG: hypothetical protein ACF8SC_12850 [Phycisphaerales bacterium JB037]
MSPAFVILFAVAVIGIVIASAIYERRRERERTELLRALAADLGFDFDERKDSSHDELFAQFEVFRRGFGRVAFNTMNGRVAVGPSVFGVRMGDFLYKEQRSNGKSSHTVTYRLSYCILMLPWPGVPRLLIRPERFLDKLTGAIGFDDIDFESAEFSRRFFVKSSDKRFAYDVVTPGMMEFLLERSDLAVDLEGGCCLFVDGTRRWSPHEFRMALARLSRFFELWPEHVVEELASRAG